MNVEIHEAIPAWRVVAMRHTGPYWQIGQTFGALMAWIGAHQVAQTGPALAISYDDPETTPEAELRSDACVMVDAGFRCEDPSVQVLDLPGGRYAITTHLGHYSGLGGTWRRFMGEWFPASGHTIEFTRPCFEVYVNDCNAVPVEEVRTDLYVPVV